MTTNFPTSVDAFTNPTSADTLDNPPHDQQHTDINDAMEAVQTSLLDGSPLKIDDANNRVGIGTTSPNETLDVQGSIGFSTGGDRTAGSLFSDSNWGLITTAAQPSPAIAEFAWFNADDTVRMAIDPSGNVGINDTTPSYKLDVNGDINATGDLRIGGTAIGEWTDYTPTYSVSSGSGLTYTNNFAKYTKIKKLVVVIFDVRITGGTSLQGLAISLPVNCAALGRGGGTCHEYAVNGNFFYWYITTSTTALMSRYDNNQTVGNTWGFRGQIIYEAA